MKTITLEPEHQDKIENVKQAEIQKQTILLGTVFPKRGHTMFEVNYKLKTIVQAELDKAPAYRFDDAQNGTKTSAKNITKKPDCIYVSALNKKNAIKILNRELGDEFNEVDYGIK